MSRPGWRGGRRSLLILTLLLCLAGVVLEYLPAVAHSCPINSAGLSSCGVGHRVSSRLGLGLAIVGALAFVAVTTLPKVPRRPAGQPRPGSRLRTRPTSPDTRSGNSHRRTRK